MAGLSTKPPVLLRGGQVGGSIRVPFNRPYLTGRELEHISSAHSLGHLAGDGEFTRRCAEWIEVNTGAQRALLTHSCTAALEMSAMLLGLAPGDEVILPSYTFVSTANAFALRGATPVFVDIRRDTLNLDESLIEDAITDRTRAICVVHYAGVAAEMDTIMSIADKYGLAVVEDAAQAILSTYRGMPVGTIGDFGALSFHETKNVMCGEGGALMCRDTTFIEDAEVCREKGTNRSRYFRGLVDKYTWVALGSSFLPSEVNAAFLWAQLEQAESITKRRLAMWERYNEWAAPHEAAGRLRRPLVPDHCGHNAHMFYMLMPSLEHRTDLIAGLRQRGVMAVFHYVPLHSSPAGVDLGRVHGDMTVTDETSERIVRLPLWPGLETEFDDVLAALDEVLGMLD